MDHNYFNKITREYLETKSVRHFNRLRNELNDLMSKGMKYESIRNNWNLLEPYLRNVSNDLLEGLKEIDEDKISLLRCHNYEEYQKLNILEKQKINLFILSSSHKFNNGNYYVIVEDKIYHQFPELD